ncbi:hypothetical protein C6A77_13450 [Pseudomonas sp. AFG_SD02_1510_Pfu_092]|nr:hypothetical protein C6A77_13450 [Pseudomonas sp. AFG_SD02_1510_Pfu_092]
MGPGRAQAQERVAGGLTECWRIFAGGSQPWRQSTALPSVVWPLTCRHGQRSIGVGQCPLPDRTTS